MLSLMSTSLSVTQWWDGDGLVTTQPQQPSFISLNNSIIKTVGVTKSSIKNQSSPVSQNSYYQMSLCRDGLYKMCGGY